MARKKTKKERSKPTADSVEARPAAEAAPKKLAENALQENEKRYRQWFKHMVSAALLMEVGQRDSQGRVTDVRILEVNPAYERLSGRSRQDVVGRCIRQIWPRPKISGSNISTVPCEASWWPG